MSLSDEAVRGPVKAFITKELMRNPAYPLRDDEPIITQGLMDSFALAELGVYVEEAFNVYIPDPDLTVAKMNTLNQIVARILQG